MVHVRVRYHPGSDYFIPPWTVHLAGATYADGRVLGFGETLAQAWADAREFCDEDLHLFQDGNEKWFEQRLRKAGVDPYPRGE